MADLAKWFKKQNKLVQLILLLIPVVNWFFEIVIRWNGYFKKPRLISLVLAIVAIPGIGVVLGYIDFFWMLLFDEFVFE